MHIDDCNYYCAKGVCSIQQKEVKTYRFIQNGRQISMIVTDREFKSGTYIMLDETDTIYCINGVTEVFDLRGNIVSHAVIMTKVS
jgi:hypothetical protein